MAITLQACVCLLCVWECFLPCITVVVSRRCCVSCSEATLTEPLATLHMVGCEKNYSVIYRNASG